MSVDAIRVAQTGDQNMVVKLPTHGRAKGLTSSLTLTAAAALLWQFSALPVAAQQASVETVEITGSRIKNADVVAPTPISVIGADDIAKTKADTIEEVLQHLIGSDFTGGLSSASNNGGVGQSQMGLRNLGPTRTLILIDGQRLIPVFNTGAAVVDLNVIPVSMIERIEVLRDGASSVYGADAIGGVINIITKKHAVGTSVSGSYGVSGHGDGTTYSGEVSQGANTDSGNVFLSASTDHRDAVKQNKRDWANTNLAGSTYRSDTSVLQDPTNAQVWVNGVQYPRNSQAWVGQAPDMIFNPQTGKTRYDAGDYQYLTGELDRKQLNAAGHYNITDDVTLVADGFYTNRTSKQQLRPEPLLADSIATPVFPGFFIPTTAPGFPASYLVPGSAFNNSLQTVNGQQGFFASLTPGQIGPRQYEQTSNTYRTHIGLEGTAFSHYDWEVGYVYQENDTQARVKNEVNFNHLAQLTGQIPCVNAPGGCTASGGLNSPVNFFNGPNIFTPAQAAFLTWTNTENNHSSERYFFGDVSGPIVDLPAGPLKAAVGGERRNEAAWDHPDSLVTEGWGPNPANPTSGAYSVTSTYGELNIPLLKGLPGIEKLDLTTSGRYDNYSSFGTAITYKGGLDYQITQDIRLRGGYGKGFRAPTVSELYGGQTYSDISASGDPCDSRAAGFNGNANIGQGLLGAGTTCARAVNGGRPVTNFTPSIDSQTDGQQQLIIGGNSALKPETAHQYTVGTVITPRWVPNLSFTTDYYNVRIKNAILQGGVAGNAGPDLVLQNCYGPAQNSSYCALISRGANGSITTINSLNTNYGVEKDQGIDFGVNYDIAANKLGVPVSGKISTSLQASYLFEHTTRTPTAPSTSMSAPSTTPTRAFSPVGRVSMLSVTPRTTGA